MIGRKLLFVLVLGCLICLARGDNTPLGNCQGGRAVPYTLAASGGTCSIPTIGIPAANVNQAFFNGGTQCGVCYQVTGPMGSQVVQVVDSCGTSSPRCGGDAVNFGIDANTFGLIANRTDVDVIYDLGFREVTCSVTGNVQMQALSTTSESYYFNLVFWNFRVGVTEVQIQGKGWTSYDALTRQGSSAMWAWNKANNILTFPLTIYIVGMTNQVISLQVPSLTQGLTVDFGSQFDDVIVGPGTTTCPMASSPAVVYTDSVAYGWDTSYSFRPLSIVLNYTTACYSGTYCISADLYAEGGLQCTRDGGFNPLYFTQLSFAGKSGSGNADVRVYMGDGTGPLSVTVQLTATWQVFNISVSDLTTASLETALVFFNAESSTEQLYFDQIQWVLNPISPLENVTQVSTTGYQLNSSATTSPPVMFTTGTGVGFNPSSSSTGHTSGAYSTRSSRLYWFLAGMLAALYFC